MRKAIAFVVVIIFWAGSLSFAQAPANDGAGRKVTTRVAPDYPALAKRMHLQGVVKVEAVVRPNGTVKSTRVIGGNPVLVDAAKDAVAQWKFEAGQNESTELIQLTFVPQ